MTKNEICRYHNDLNKVKLPQFNEVQLNIFYALIHKMRHKQQGKLVTFSPKEIWDMIGGTQNRTTKELLEIIVNLFEKIAKMDFKRIIEYDNVIEREIINLFKVCRIKCEKNDLSLAEVQLEINEHFEYLLGEFLGNFTEFELVELVAISGKYTKLLYTHLKQYRATGEWLVEWSDFKELLDIPKNYRPCDIDTFIIKPAIKELTAERTLFDQKRIPFKNLKCEKLTQNKEPNRRKLTPYWIRFTFKKEDSTKLLNVELNGKFWLWRDSSGKELIYRVDKVIKEPNKVVVVCSVFDKDMYSVSPYFTFTFDSPNQAFETITNNLWDLKTKSLIQATND